MSDDREKFHTDLFRNALAFFLISAFVGVLPLLIFKTIPTDNKEVIVYIIGQLSGMATTALAFYFTQKAGQDALDKTRAESTGKLADAVVAAANAPGPALPPVDAIQAADTVADAAADAAEHIKGGDQ